MHKLIKLISSLKFRYHLTFVEVIFGYWVGNGFSIGSGDAYKLIFVFFVFCLLFYNGVYLFNDIVDFEKDKLHPLKKFRPLAAGKISVREAVVLAFVLVGLSLALSLILGLDFFVFILAFLAFNIFYSLVFKNIPYLEVLANAFTHPLRIVLGIVLAGQFSHEYFWILAFDFFMATSLSFLKRKNDTELQNKFGGAALCFYSNGIIIFFIGLFSFLNLVVILFCDSNFLILFGIATFLIQISIAVGVSFSKTAKDILYYKIWK